ncbi:cyclic nucleotide-binding domain-containing protein [Candidatus Poribacteria bacterium]|nr:cyclic nucleotide-binding domain-containing protein [Candidatus Poribacteria bacterium]
MLSKSLRQQILSSVFRINPGEGFRVGLMLLYSISAVGGVVITGKLLSRALFLSALPPSAVLFKFILPPIFLAPVILIYTRVAGRIQRDQSILAVNALVLIGVLSFRLLLNTPLENHFAVLCALFVFFDVISSLVMIQFWTFAGDIFNPREAKRLFGLIAGGGTIASILFGAALSSVATSVAPKNLIFVVLFSLLVCVFCVRVLGRKYRKMLKSQNVTSQETQVSKRHRIVDDLQEVMRTPLMLSMSGIIVILALVSSITDYQLDLALQSGYGTDSRGMVVFLSHFRLWTGIAAGLLQFFLAVRLLERFGVLTALLLLPIAIGFSSTAILITGGLFWVVILPRACDFVLKYTINDPAFNLLYLPVSPQMRAKARAILDGIIVPPAVSLLGISFLFANKIPGVTIVRWPFPVFVFIGMWIFLLIRVSRQYVFALSDSIRLRRFDPDVEIMELSDESKRVLINTLQHADSMQALHALTLLPRVHNVDWNPYVAELLDHESPEVRILAMEYLGEHAAATYAERVRQQFNYPDQRVRATAIQTLCALHGQKAIKEVIGFLHDSSPHIRGATVIGLIKHGGLDGFLHAGEQLRALLDSPEPRGRLEGARVLGALGVKSFYQPLMDLLEDDNIEVQISAIRAAAQIRAPELIPALLRKLSSARTRPYATEAIGSLVSKLLNSQCTAAKLSDLEALLDDANQPIAVHQQLISILQQQDSPQAVQILAKYLDADEDELRTWIYQALLNLRTPTPIAPPLSPRTRGEARRTNGIPLSIETKRFREALHKEFQIAYALEVLRSDVGMNDTDLLLYEVIERQKKQAVERILSLIALLYPNLPVDSVRASLAKSDSRLRATAIELVDNIADSEVKVFILPLIGSSSDEKLTVARRRLGLKNRSLTERLEELAHHTDIWLSTCVLYSIGAHKLTELAPIIETALAAEYPLVRETAVDAFRHLYPSERNGEKLLAFGLQGVHIMALSTIEKVLFLKTVPLFKQISGEELVEMVPIVHEVRFGRGETIMKQGDEGDCLYIIVEGEVAIKVDGEEKAIRARGDILGELAVLSEQPRTADGIAQTDIIALRIDKADFWELMSERPEITIGVMKVLVSRYL